jgi:hypothetical protein
MTSSPVEGLRLGRLKEGGELLSLFRPFPTKSGLVKVAGQRVGKWTEAHDRRADMASAFKTSLLHVSSLRRVRVPGQPTGRVRHQCAPGLHR